MYATIHHFRVLGSSSKNKVSFGDVLELNQETVVVAYVSKKHAYINDIAYNVKQINRLLRQFYYDYQRGKSMYLNGEL